MSLTHTWQLRAARAIVGLSQADLAAASGASLATIKRLEIGDGVLVLQPDTRDKLRRTLEAAGLDFIGENGGGVGVRTIKGYPERVLPSDEGISFSWPRPRGDRTDGEFLVRVRISAATLKDLCPSALTREARATAFRLHTRFIIERVEALASKRVVAGSIRLRIGDLRPG